MNMTNIKQFNIKKRKVTLPNIVSPAKKNTSDAEFSDDTSTIEEEEGVNDRKYDRNKNIMWIKSQNSQMTLPVLIWRKVLLIEKIKVKKMMREKRLNALMTLPVIKLSKV